MRKDFRRQRLFEGLFEGMNSQLEVGQTSILVLIDFNPRCKTCQKIMAVVLKTKKVQCPWCIYELL